MENNSINHSDIIDIENNDMKSDEESIKVKIVMIELIYF